MKTIKPATTLSDLESRECESLSGRAAAEPNELRALSDYELWFVGGGDDIPHW